MPSPANVALLLLPLVVLPGASLHAQERSGVGGRLVTSCPTPGAPWLLSVQADDGRWPADFAPGTDAHAEPGSTSQPRDLRATALATLALCADGHTLRAGPHRVPLQRAVRWLRAQQDDKGRIALSTAPDWILDHAMATYALCEAERRSPSIAVRTHARSAMDALASHLERLGTRAEPEVLAWGALCARSAEAWEVPAPPAASRLRAVAARRAATLAADTERQRAALVLLRSLDDAADAADVASLAGPLLAPAWPADLSDPLAVLYVALVVYRRADQPGFEGAWKRLSTRLTRVLVMREITTGEFRGSWDPCGESASDGGRVGTTAVSMLLMTLYYRYCQLEVAS